MTRKLLSGAFLLCASVAAAQAPVTPQPAPTVQHPPAPDQTVTYTGCLQRGLAATSPTPSAVSTSGTGGFVLANATRGTTTIGDLRNPIGTSGGAPTVGVSYRLEGDQAALAPHVGHKVEISGMLNEHLAAPANRDTTSGDTGRTSGNPATLKVESVKMIASECMAR